MRFNRLYLIAAIGVAGFYGAAEAQSVRIANEGGIRDEWMLADGVALVAPGYPASFAQRRDNVCVAMGYRIHPDGTTGEFTMLRGWNSSGGDKEPVAGFWNAFSRASAGALAQWRFRPRSGISAPRAVDTVATMTFVGRATEGAGVLRAKCYVADLHGALQKAKAEMARRGDMNMHTLDSNYRETTRNEARRNSTKSAQNVD